MTGKEEKGKLKVFALPCNPDCVFCQFYILDSLGNGSHRYKREKRTLGVRGNKDKGRGRLVYSG